MGGKGSGGQRKHAGRKPRYGKRIEPSTIRLSDDDKAELQKLVPPGAGLSEAIRKAIEIVKERVK